MRVRTMQSRPGAIVPLAALMMTGLCAFIALALDLGIIMVARNQCQNAADAAAMAGARTLNGDTSTNNNYSNVQPNAVAAAQANSVFGQSINASNQLTITIGDYYYNAATSAFQINATGLGNSGDNYTLVQATVTSNQSLFFARVFGMSTLTATAKATAAHRPRDTVIVVDFSGSMRFESLLSAPYYGSRTLSMNPDTVYPTWGQYQGNSSQLIYSGDQTAPGGEDISAANITTTTTNSNASVISGFYGDATAFGTSTPAFTAAPSSYGTTPNGDVPLTQNKNNSATYAKTVSDFLNAGTLPTSRDWRFELDGYSAYAGGVANASLATATDYTNAPFKGYTQGPGYWGKTFMTWPPDPRVPLTTTYYTAGQITSIVNQFLTDFGYTAADFANTSVTVDAAIVTTTATTLSVANNNAGNFPTGFPFKVMMGTTSGGAFTGSPEVLSVSAASGSATNGITSWTVARGQDGTSAAAVVKTTLSAGMTAGTTSLSATTAAGTAGFPATPFKIMVGALNGGNTAFTGTCEIMNVTSIGTGKNWTVQRGQDGTTANAMTNGFTVALVQTVGLLTGPPLYGIYTAASTNISATVGTTPSGSNVWSSWSSAATLGSYLTGNVYDPGSSAAPIDKLQTTDANYQQLLRLYCRNGGTGMPKDSTGAAMPCDWRTRFFTYASTGLPVMDNDSTLYSSGTLRAPSSGGYLINYSAILDWIKNCGPNPFPAQLRAGGIVYYTSIPSTINTASFPPTDPNQRFWKEYIDDVLGFMQTGGSGSSPNYSVVSQYNGYGDDIPWGSVSTSGQPSGWPTSTYINYSDNPNRPLLRGWFGPLTMVDYLGNYNASDPSNNNSPRLWWPGTVTEAPTYQTKLGIQAAIEDTFYNHPNDNVSLIFFSSPRDSASATGYYNHVPVPLSRNERLMINSLWFAPKVISTNAEINLYNSSGVNTGDIYTVPRANGGTCYSMGLMLAYNQFSSNSALLNFTANAPTGSAGGNGRNGASKMLVFETDGMVNTGASAPLVSSTNGQGYYKVRMTDANNYSAGGTEFPTNVNGVSFSTGASQSQAIAQQICNTQANGGYSTSNKPVTINCLAFGSLFEGSSGNATNALSNLAALEVIGNVQPAGATTLASNKIIVGNFSTRIANMQTAFRAIMQDGIHVTLIASGTGQP